ncbi:MAG: hypothetical protein C6I05_07330 [Epsilonproteobacteria bacterium]|nr:hypothetical protein [Campylobacterota bacterium]
MKTVSKSSFTLFELLVVILIISIIYAIFVERLSTKEETIKSQGLQGLPSLLTGYPKDRKVELVCTDNCRRCFIYLDGNRSEEIDSPFTQEVAVYDYDIHGLLSQLHFTPIFDGSGAPQEVCLRYSLYPNRSRSSYILQHGERFYIYFPYLRPPATADSLQEAGELLDPSQWIPTESSEYTL